MSLTDSSISALQWQLLQRHATTVLGRWLRRAHREGWLRFDNADGLKLWPEELRLHFERLQRADGLEWSKDFAEVDWSVFSAMLDDAEAKQDLAAVRWRDLADRLRLSPAEQQLLALLCVLEYDVSMARAFRYGCADFQNPGFGWGFALKLLAPPEQLEQLAEVLHPQRSPLFRFELLRLHAPRPSSPLSEQQVQLAEDVAPFLLGARLECEAFRSFDALAAPPQRLRDLLRPRLRRLLALPGPLRAAVCGPKGSGRLAVAGQLAQGAHVRGGVFLIDLGRAVLHGRANDQLKQAIRIAVLQDCAVILRGLGTIGEGSRLWLERAQDTLAKLPNPVIWLFEGESPAELALPPEAILGLSYPQRSEREQLWTQRLGGRVKPAGIEQLAGQFLLSEGQIARVVRDTLAAEADAGQKVGGTGQAPNRQELGGTGQAPNRQELGGTGQAPNRQELGGTGQAPNRQEVVARRRRLAAKQARRVRAMDGAQQLVEQLAINARRAAQHGLGRLATPEHGRVRFEQLVLEEETSTALQELISYSSHRHQLAEDWGFAASMPYGLGVTALFTGPSGTGKTFAAQAIATALRLELYRVDLSQLVSKYIGETEKHLSELFAAAEQGEVLLLFDEADSIFGKRTEVKTSVDRYANLEVNYLLQRIERFAGVTILTTNFEASIDEAFARRIRFRVPFEPPNEAARLLLWQKLIPSAVPLAKDLDLPFLAKYFELSGGHIKEIVLRAASLALSSESRTLSQRLLLRSARLEYKKLGKLPPLDAEDDNPELGER